jgi:hypoxanthine phosphoribosyltransferase
MAPELIRVLSKAEIRERVKTLGKSISEDYGDNRLVILGVLKGAFVFLADLIREIKIPFEVEFIQLASYGADTQSSGEVKQVKAFHIDLAELHIFSNVLNNFVPSRFGFVP